MDGLLFEILSLYKIKSSLSWLLNKALRLIRRGPSQYLKTSLFTKILEAGVV